MITREQLEEYLGEERESGIKAFTKDIDHDVEVITLLRKRIPYEKVKGIIQGAEHDVLYLVDIEECLEYLSVDDLIVLAECNVFLDEDNDSLALFV